MVSGSALSGLAAPSNGGVPVNTQPPSAENTGDVIVDPVPAPPGSTTPGTGSSGSTVGGTRFSCQVLNGQYTVLYQPESRPGQSYPWAVPSAMGGGWEPARRCFEISRRLESYRPDGLLEMQTALENGYNTICVTTQRVPSCRIVLTVPPGQDPLVTRDRVFQNLTIADSGQQTQGVNTFVSGRSGIVTEATRWLNIRIPGLGQPTSASNAINLRPFLDRKDGGTGAYLKQSVPNQPGRRLNPNQFRYKLITTNVLFY
jgi:hypothetical protein